MDAKANVCAVRWRPGSSHELAVGSADHSAYLYDLRHTAHPLRTFQGHRKAVSYVRFCSPAELVSASTDSTLRLWGVEGGPCAAPGASVTHNARVYEGHANEKNFVGLSGARGSGWVGGGKARQGWTCGRRRSCLDSAPLPHTASPPHHPPPPPPPVDGDFMACGSETSELYVYYKALSKPVAQQAFGGGPDDGLDGAAAASADKTFISAVCWRPGSQTLLAANSQGIVKVFNLTGSSEVPSGPPLHPR